MSTTTDRDSQARARARTRRIRDFPGSHMARTIHPVEGCPDRAPLSRLVQLGQRFPRLVLPGEDLGGVRGYLEGLPRVIPFAHLAVGHPEVVLHLRIIGQLRRALP